MHWQVARNPQREEKWGIFFFFLFFSPFLLFFSLVLFFPVTVVDLVRDHVRCDSDAVLALLV